MFPRQDHGRFSVTDDGTLIIEPVRKEDAGEYVCQALSVAGSAFAKAEIQVKGEKESASQQIIPSYTDCKSVGGFDWVVLEPELSSVN